MVDDVEKKADKADNKKTASMSQSPMNSVVPESSERVKEKVYYLEVIKSCWTHEPWLYFKIVVNEKKGV